MKFYLSSAQDREPYIDLKRNKLMQKYLREIKEAGFKVTFEKDTTYEGYQHIVVDMLSRKELVQLMKAVGYNVKVTERQFEDDKYPKICIYDNYIESILNKMLIRRGMIHLEKR